jgi:hypothetical protein
MDGNLNVYGWANLDTTKTDADIYVQAFENDKYLPPVKLCQAINSDAVEYCPEVSRNGKLLFFCRMGAGKQDGIYFSRKIEGIWQTAIRLPDSINMGYAERFPKYDEIDNTLYFNRQVFNYHSNSNRKLSINDVQEQYLNKPQNGGGDIYYYNYQRLLKQMKTNSKK